MGILQHLLEFILAKRHKEQHFAKIIFAKFNSAKLKTIKINCHEVTFVTQDFILDTLGLLKSYSFVSFLGNYFEFKNVHNLYAFLLCFIRLLSHSYRIELW